MRDGKLPNGSSGGAKPNSGLRTTTWNRDEAEARAEECQVSLLTRKY